MPAELRFTAEQHNKLLRHLLADDDEHAAVLMCGTARNRPELLLCHQVVPLTAADLEASSGRLHLEVSPLTIARLAKQAKADGRTLVVCHSHPFHGPVQASSIDLETEFDLCGRVLPGRLAGRPVGALIVGPDGFEARVWMDRASSALHLRVGGRLIDNGDDNADPTFGDERDARHLLVWGLAGQTRLQRASVVIVGAGGTGSHLVLQLAHLGIGRLVLVDPDIVEPSNLGRLVGATTADVGRRKVEVLASTAARIRPEIVVESIAASVLDIDAKTLAGNDLIVCCTDGHGSRSLLNELAAQYVMTLVDLGIEVQSAREATRAGGGVRIVRPGEPCLNCMDVLDPGLVREDFLSDAQQRDESKRGYLRGNAEPAPSVIALNGVVASLAVLEVLHELLGLFASSPHRVLYRAEARSVTTADATSRDTCYVCGPAGISGLGDARRLPRRPSEPRTGSG